MNKEEHTTAKTQAGSGRRRLLQLLAAHPWPPVIVWLSLSFTLSSIPGDAYPQVRLPWASQTVHLILYAGLSLLLLRALRRRFPGFNPAGLIALTIMLGFCWGLSDEWHQEYFVANRAWENLDLAMDAIGLMAGAAAYYGLRAAFLRL